MLDHRLKETWLLPLPTKRSASSRKVALAMAKSLREQFGREIREARLQAGMSQTDLGERINKAQTYVSELEHGHINLTIDTMLLMAHAVGLKVVLGMHSEQRRLD